MVRQAPVICVMVPPIHLGAWSMALMLWLPFELLLLLLSSRVEVAQQQQTRKMSSYGKMAAKNRHSREVGRVSPQRLAAATNRNRHR